MNRLPYALVAAAIAVAIGGAVLLMRPGTDRQSGGRADAISFAVACRIGDNGSGRRVDPGRVAGPLDGRPERLRCARCRVVDPVDGESLELAQSNENTNAETESAGLTLGCRDTSPHSHRHTAMRAGTGGDYEWSLSPSGRVLTLSVVVDACAARGTALAGTWWKMGCTSTDDNCLGLLDAGTYKSQFIAPRVIRAPPGARSSAR